MTKNKKKSKNIRWKKDCILTEIYLTKKHQFNCIKTLAKTGDSVLINIIFDIGDRIDFEFENGNIVCDMSKKSFEFF